MNTELALSKRQQKKLQQAVRLIEATQPSHSKPRKKRKLQSHIQINYNHLETVQEEQQNLHQTKSTLQLTPLHEKPKEEEVCQDREDALENNRRDEDGLNSEYQLKGNDLGTFLIVYQYEQSQKMLQKQQKDLTFLDNKGQPLLLLSNKKSVQLCQKLQSLKKQLLNGKNQVFSKQHRILSKEFKKAKPQCRL